MFVRFLLASASGEAAAACPLRVSQFKQKKSTDEQAAPPGGQREQRGFAVHQEDLILLGSLAELPGECAGGCTCSVFHRIQGCPLTAKSSM